MQKEAVVLKTLCRRILAVAASCTLCAAGAAGTSVTGEEPEQADTTLTAMLSRAQAIVDYEWVPSRRIATWNDNPYQGKNYFEAGETVKGMPYTLFSWELGVDSLLSLEQYRAKVSENYDASAYCLGAKGDRTGPVYGNCCATMVSEVFGGHFMQGANPRYDGVKTVQNSEYALTYRNVKLSAIQPGDALSCTSGTHIVWVGQVTEDDITIYESTPPVCRQVTLDKAGHTDGEGYLVYNGNIYNIVTKSAQIIRDDLVANGALVDISMPLFAYTKSSEKTVVYDGIEGAAKSNKIYASDRCLIDAIFDNGWCHVNFPLDTGGLDHGYVKTSVFFDENRSEKRTAGSGIPVFRSADLSEASGRIPPGSEYTIVGESASAVQVIYSLPTGGYELGWASVADLEQTGDVPFLHTLCPIRGYPCAEENFEVFQSDYTTRSGEIYTSDYCTVNAVYGDGWCQVTFPMDSGGERTAYTTLDHFVIQPETEPQAYVTTEQITVYPKKDLQQSQNWWTGTGDTIYILGESGEALQICYPIDERYGGGYKLGWIPKDAVPKEESVPGDMDANRVVNVWDGVLLGRYLAGWDIDIPSASADLDHDGEITGWDAVILLRYLGGWEVSLT